MDVNLCIKEEVDDTDGVSFGTEECYGVVTVKEEVHIEYEKPYTAANTDTSNIKCEQEEFFDDRVECRAPPEFAMDISHSDIKKQRSKGTESNYRNANANMPATAGIIPPVVSVKEVIHIEYEKPTAAAGSNTSNIWYEPEPLPHTYAMDGASNIFEGLVPVVQSTPSTSNYNNDFQSTILDGVFFETVQRTFGTDNVVAICKKCLPHKTKIKGLKSCTSNFKLHLKRKHGQEAVQEYEEYVKSKKPKTNRGSSSSIELSPRRNIIAPAVSAKDVHMEYEKPATAAGNIEYEPERLAHNTTDGTSNIPSKDESSIERRVPVVQYTPSTSNYNDFKSTILDGVFFETVRRISGTDNVVAICKKCLPCKTQIKGNKSCTSNFKLHLKRKHGQEAVQEYEEYVKSKKPKTDRGSSSSVELSHRRNVIAPVPVKDDVHIKYEKPVTAAGSNIYNIEYEPEPLVHAYTMDGTSNILLKDESSIEELVPIEVSPRKKTVTLYSQDEFDRDIVKYFVNSLISLKCADDPYFRKILQRLNAGANNLRLMSRLALGRKITEFYDEECTSIQQELGQVKHVCTTVDIWSGSRRSFVGVTAHWINSHNLKRVSRALACRRFKGTHSYDKIYELLQEIISTFGLDSASVVACITDNGSNFVKAFKNFGVQRINVGNEQGNINSCDEDSNTDSTDSENVCSNDISSTVNYFGLPLRLRCASHTLSLCATDANKILENRETELSKMHDQTMKKCNILWEAANGAKSADFVQNILGHTLKTPVETRWSSLYDALSKIAAMKDKSTSLHGALNIKNPLCESDFTYIKEYLSCTKPIADAVNILQGENASYYGILLPTILTLKRKLINLTQEASTYEYCRSLVEAYLANLLTRFHDFFHISGPQAENAALAAISHPKYKKLKWTSLVGQTNYEKMKCLLVKEILKNLPKESSRKSPSARSREDEYFDIDSDSENQCSESRSKAELLVSQFIAEENREFHLLNDHPEVKKVFLRYNTPLSSSAPVERFFSYATMANCPKANRMSEEMFEKRVVLKVNMKYKVEN